MWKEFKAFIMKGNVLDLAVAVIIAAAFGAIVTSFTNDILMPPIGMALGDVDFSELKYVLQEASLAADGSVAAEEVAIRWGKFVKFVIDFIIIGFVLFLVVKAYNSSKKKEEEAPAAPAGPTQEELLAEIRDLLKK
jgi:large conductance mechanosensitive channel